MKWTKHPRNRKKKRKEEEEEEEEEEWLSIAALDGKIKYHLCLFSLCLSLC